MMIEAGRVFVTQSRFRLTHTVEGNLNFLSPRKPLFV